MLRPIVLFLLHLMLAGGLTQVYAKAVPIPGFSYSFFEELKDTTKKGGGGGDSTGVGLDSLQQAIVDSMRLRADMEAPISYSASDSMILDVEAQTLFLTRGGKLSYQEMTLSADSIGVNWKETCLTAQGLPDTSGAMVGKPVFEEGEQTYYAGYVRYNFKTQKGYVDFARTQQGEDFVSGERIKKEGANTYYIKNGRFTSCNLEDPHYYIRATKLKIIPKKQIISGPLMMVIEDFPIPVVIPFGFFPNSTGKRSGILMPTYGESAERGFFLRGLGYYFALNEHMDLAVRGDLFTKGGFGVDVSSMYNWRYKAEGQYQIRYGRQVYGEKGDPDRNPTHNFRIDWKHSQPINPQTSFRANVAIASAGFNQRNSYVDNDYLTNTLVSSVVLNKSFPNSPWNMVLNLDHNQSTKTRIMNLGLPTLSVTRSRWYPFKGQQSKGAWYEKIGMNYSANFQNKISAIDSFIPDILLRPRDTIYYPSVEGDTTLYPGVKASSFFQNGITHTIPINTSLNLGSFVTLTPDFKYKEYWYFQTVQKTWNDSLLEVSKVPGFATARDFSASATFNTRIYGFYAYSGKRQSKLRHTLTPSAGYSFRPDFSDDRWGFYETVQKDTLGNTQKYSRFEGLLMGGPPSGEQQAIQFGLANQFELKYLSNKALTEKDSTKKDPFTRLTLIDNFGITSSYNFAADSFAFAPLNVNLRSNLFQNKVTFNGNATFNPYQRNLYGRQVEVYAWDVGQMPRLERLNLQFNTGIRSKPKEKLNREGQPEDELETVAYYQDLYVDFNVPWSLNLGMSFLYTDYRVKKDTTLTVNFRGDVNLTPKWKISFTSGYDFVAQDFSYTTVDIYRDLHCWEMSFRWIPFGLRKSYNFTINVKSATLRDLKLTKRRDWQDRFAH